MSTEQKSKWNEQQFRVWMWQHDMLQPVCPIEKFGKITALPEFAKNQIGFLKEEASFELQGAIQAGDRADLADALADSLFVALGLLNIIGAPCANAPKLNFSKLPAENQIEVILKALDRAVLPQDVLDYTSDLVTCLEEIATRNNIPLAECFDRVCKSNDTKFWTSDEVAYAKEDPKYDGWSMTRVSQNGWVVKDQNGKVRKSPHFEQPDFGGLL